MTQEEFTQKVALKLAPVARCLGEEGDLLPSSRFMLETIGMGQFNRPEMRIIAGGVWALYAAEVLRDCALYSAEHEVGIQDGETYYVENNVLEVQWNIVRDGDVMLMKPLRMRFRCSCCGGWDAGGDDLEDHSDR